MHIHSLLSCVEKCNRASPPLRLPKVSWRNIKAGGGLSPQNLKTVALKNASFWNPTSKKKIFATICTPLPPSFSHSPAYEKFLSCIFFIYFSFFYDLSLPFFFTVSYVRTSHENHTRVCCSSLFSVDKHIYSVCYLCAPYPLIEGSHGVLQLDAHTPSPPCPASPIFSLCSRIGIHINLCKNKMK